jgi:hypothetical protein
MQLFIVPEPSRVWQRDQAWRALQATARLSAVVFCLVLCPGRCPAQSNSMPHLDQVVSVQSIFTDDPKFGKDPFFPKSGRRVVQVAVPVGTTPDLSMSAQNLAGLALKGISGSKDKRLALINNRTLQINEEGEFKINGHTLKLRCVEIREKSVVISVDGFTETKELFLRQGL